MSVRLLRAELDALIDLVDRLVGQVDRGHAVSTLVRNGEVQLVDRIGEVVPGIDMCVWTA
jgi:hypothetical protein